MLKTRVPESAYTRLQCHSPQQDKHQDSFHVWKTAEVFKTFQANLCTGAWQTAHPHTTSKELLKFKQYLFVSNLLYSGLCCPDNYHQQATKYQLHHGNLISHTAVCNFLPLCLFRTLEQTQISLFLFPCSVHSLLWFPLQWQVLDFWQRWEMASPVPQALPVGHPSPSCSLKNALSQ